MHRTKEANPLLERTYITVAINQLQCHTMQEFPMIDKYARFVKTNSLLADMATLQSRQLEIIILVHQMELKKM